MAKFVLFTHVLVSRHLCTVNSLLHVQFDHGLGACLVGGWGQHIISLPTFCSTQHTGGKLAKNDSQPCTTSSRAVLERCMCENFWLGEHEWWVQYTWEEGNVNLVNGVIPRSTPLLSLCSFVFGATWYKLDRMFCVLVVLLLSQNFA